MTELIVCMGLVGLLMICIGEIVRAGSRYYSNTTKTTDLQQSCLLTATALASELSEGNMRAIVTTPHEGLVFCSPRNPDGQVVFDTSRNLMWQKWVSYYTVDQGSKGFALIRKEEFLTAPESEAPFVPGDKDLAHFRGDATNVGRQVTRFVYDLDVTRTYPLVLTIGAQDEVGEFRVMVQTKVKMRN